MGLSTITPETRSEEFIDRIARAMGSGGTSPLDTIVPETRHEEFIDRIARANGWEDVSPMASIYPETRLEEFLNRIADNAGGGSVSIETGIITPDSDMVNPAISFSETHDKAPFCCVLQDITNDYCGIHYAAGASMILNYMEFSNIPVYASTTDKAGLFGVAIYRQSDDATYWSRGNIGAPPESVDTIVSNTGFRPLLSNYKLIAGRSYKWLAVWL